MIFKCCEYLLNEIVFAQSCVLPCCCSPTHDCSIRLIEHYDGKTFDTEQYIMKRNEYIQQFKKGDIPKSCIGCFKIQEKEWDEIPKLNRIIVTHRTKCSCNCFYCSLVTTSNQSKKELNTRKVYDILPIIKNLFSKNLIQENCLITVAGGECSEYPAGELEYIIYLASLLNCKLEILSSGLFYSETIEKALKTEECELRISVDSGSEGTFEKIKRVKGYNAVWSNIAKYIKQSVNNEHSFVRLKYIIIEGVNDNKEEAKQFLLKCSEVGCSKIEIAFEYLWYDKNKDKPLPKSIRETVNILKQSGLDISYEGQFIGLIEENQN